MKKNLDYIEKQYKEHIKEMNPLEFGLYQRYFITGLYEAFIENNDEKALKYKEMLEDISNYYNENHTNVYIKEIERRLDTANEFLIKALEENRNTTMLYIEASYDEDNKIITLSNQILKALMEYNESNEEKVPKKLIEDILEITELRIDNIKYFIDIHEEDYPELSKNMDYPLYWLIKEYNEYQELKEQIKQL